MTLWWKDCHRLIRASIRRLDRAVDSSRSSTRNHQETAGNKALLALPAPMDPPDHLERKDPQEPKDQRATEVTRARTVLRD